MKKRRWQSIIVVAVFSMISALCFTQDLVLAAYPPPEFKNVMVFHFEEDSGNSGTFFYATISGPSPEDVASLTAMGPSGTFSLVPRGTFQQFGLYFGCYHSSVVDNGTYTFTLTDSLGRTTSVQRDFTYAGTLPQVDTATMTPAHQSYVGTITPTLAFSPVSGDYLYQVFIQDLDRTAVWYSSDYKDATSFAVPEGVLQPNMAYQWVVRVWDRNLQNRHDSAPLYFYTGTKTTPEIDIYAVLSFPWGEQQLLNYPYARGLHVAPWDIDYFKATGPDNAVYNLLLRRYYCFYFPMYYANVTTLDPPTTSVPDGTYRFEIKDTIGHVVSVQRDYAFNPIPDFVSDSRMPADNAYFDTDRPTFSWGRVTGDPGDGSYIYSMRITGYFQNMRWYDSPYSSDTTFTPPEPLNLPKGTSYRWRVNVQRANGTGNYRSTSYRTFTLNDRPKDPGPYIQANGSSGPFGVRTGVPVSMQVSLYPGPYAGYNAEWWIATDTPMGWYSYVYPAGWLAGIQRCTAMPLAPIAPTEILNMILPLGGYAFYFALDGIIDGIPEPALVDSAKFIVFDTRVVARFTGTQPHIHGLAYSPTGELALAFYDSPLIKFINPQTGAEIRTIDVQRQGPCGLCFMGGSLWRLSWDGELAEINPNTGQILRTITNPSWPTGLEGLTWDGTHFWFGVDNSSDLYRISADGGIQERITTPSRSNNGLAWDGQGLWIADDRSNSLLRYDPLNRSVTARIETGQESVQSVTCGGGSLWIGSNGLLQQVMY